MNDSPGLRPAGARIAQFGENIFFVSTASNDLEGVIRQRPLQRLRLIPRRTHQQRLARQAMEMQIGSEREQELSSPPNRLDKIGNK